MSSSSSSQNIPACYFSINGTIHQAAPEWVPCYTPSAGQTNAPCCRLGSYCLEGNICFDGNGDDQALYTSLDESPYYTAGSVSIVRVYYIHTDAFGSCTDKHYEDPEACTTNCEQQSDPEIIYNANNGQWQCCAGNCSMALTDDEFRDPAPGQFQVLTSLAVDYAPYETFVIEAISNSILSLALTNLPSFSAAFNSSYGTSTVPTWLNELPSAVVGEIFYGSAVSDIYTGPATLSATASVTMPVTTMPSTLSTTRSVSTPTTSLAPLPAPSHKSNAAVIGPAVGVPVAVLLIGAIIGAIIYSRRRRRRQATANRGDSHADQETSQGQRPVTQYPSGPPPFYVGSPEQQVAENPSYNTYASSENHYQSAPLNSFAEAPTSKPQLGSAMKTDGPVFGATAGPVRETLHELESPDADHELDSSPLGHA